MAPSSSFPVAIAQAAGPVLVARRDGEAWQIVELSPEGWWPAWGLNGNIALSYVQTSGGESVATLKVVDTADPMLAPTIVARDSPAALIAPRTAHYVLWRDDGEELCYVAPSEGRLTLFAATPGGVDGPRKLVAGAPLFPAWQPGRPRLAVHHASVLTIVDTESGSSTTVSERAAGFRTPAYRDDGGWLAFAEPAAGGVEVSIVESDGSARQEVTRVNGGVALAFRPGSRELTVSVSRAPASGVFDELLLLDPRSGGRRRLWRGPFIAYWWSRPGERLAIVVPTQSGDGRYQLHILGPDGTVLASAEPIVPSQDLRTVLAFFDQYRLSHRLWAPDGSAILLAGRLVSDGIASSFGDPPGDCVYWFSGERGAPLERIAGGMAGFFPPHAPDQNESEVNEG